MISKGELFYYSINLKQEIQMINSLHGLSRDLIAYTFRCGLNASDWGKLSRVCIKFKEILKSPNFQLDWQKALHSDFDNPCSKYTYLPPKVNWRKFYLFEANIVYLLKCAKEKYIKDPSYYNLMSWAKMLIEKAEGDNFSPSYSGKGMYDSLCYREWLSFALQPSKCYEETAELLSVIGVIYYLINNGIESFNSLTKSFDLGSTETRTLTYLARCYYCGNGVTENKEKAIELYKLAADHGEPYSQMWFAKILYQKGDTESFKYMKAAAEKGIAVAQSNLGCFYNDPFGVSKDSKMAVYYWNHAAQQGDARAQLFLGNSYYFGKGVEKDLNQALVFIQLSADQGYADGEYQLAELHMNREGTEHDPKKAFHYYELAAKKGKKEAQSQLGYCYYEGIGTPIDKGKALHYFTLSAEQGCRGAHACLGSYYILVEPNPEKAFYHTKIAADLGNTEAQCRTGRLYCEGDGTDLNKTEGIRYYELAAEQGHKLALRRLGIIYALPHSTPLNPEKAFLYLNRAAENEDPIALSYLGLLHYKGVGTEVNFNRAFEYLKHAADLDCKISQDLVGYLYENGEGTDQDLSQAFHYYSLAANRGHEESQYKVGCFYEAGTGTSINLAKAFQYYKKAADNGNLNAQKKVVECYEKGIGVSVDCKAAKRYLNIAAQQESNE
jgi:TPR repeat protein